MRTSNRSNSIRPAGSRKPQPEPTKINQVWLLINDLDLNHSELRQVAELCARRAAWQTGKAMTSNGTASAPLYLVHRP
jgi:hypothetical protein